MFSLIISLIYNAYLIQQYFKENDEIFKVIFFVKLCLLTVKRRKQKSKLNNYAPFQMAFIQFFYEQSFPEFWCTEARSESTDPVESGSNPDPTHWKNYRYDVTILTGISVENRVRTVRVSMTKTWHLWAQGFFSVSISATMFFLNFAFIH